MSREWSGWSGPNWCCCLVLREYPQYLWWLSTLLITTNTFTLAMIYYHDRFKSQLWFGSLSLAVWFFKNTFVSVIDLHCLLSELTTRRLLSIRFGHEMNFADRSTCVYSPKSWAQSRCCCRTLVALSFLPLLLSACLLPARLDVLAAWKTLLFFP